MFDGPAGRFSSGSDESGRPMLVISTIVTTLYTSDSVSHESEDVMIVANTDSEATAQMSVYKYGGADGGEAETSLTPSKVE